MPDTTSHRCELIYIFLTICIVLLSTSQLSAEIIEVPLTDLHGTYTHEGIEIRSDTLLLDRIPIEIFSVSFKISGTGLNGLMACDAGSDGACRSLGLHWAVTMEDTATVYKWLPDNQGSAGGLAEESLALIFDIHTNSSWSYLLSGESTIILQARLWPYPFGPNHCSWCDYPVAEIYGVWLVIDATFPTGVEESTWGAIKALME